MTARLNDQSGFTLIEMLVTMLLLSVISIGFYQVMFATVGASDTTASLTRISEEARHGFNRMIRDTREAARLQSATPTSYRVWVNFNEDSVIDHEDYELVEFRHAGDEIRLVAIGAGGSPTEDALLIDNVRAVDHVSPAGDDPVFTYSSDYLQFDTNGDGVASQAELVSAVGATESLEYIGSVHFNFRVEVGDRTSTFTSRAQLRNKRFGI